MTQEPGARRGMTGDVERDGGLDRLYRETLNACPPAHLAAGILAAARREVGAHPRALRPALSRWRLPLSIAAVVVLSVSLVIMVREEGGDQLVIGRPAPPPAAVAPAAKPESPLRSPAPPSADALRRPPTEPAPESREAAPAEEARGGGIPAPAGPPVPSRPDSRGAVRGAPSPAAGQAAKPAGPQPFPVAPGERLEQPAGAAAEAAPKTAVSGSLRTAPAATPPAGEDAELARGRLAAERQEERRARADVAARPAAAPPPRSMSEAPSPAAAAVRAQAQSTGAKEERGAAPGDHIATLIRALDKEPPEKWLARIQELRRERAMADADALLAEFKRRFPGYPLPSELE